MNWPNELAGKLLLHPPAGPAVYFLLAGGEVVYIGGSRTPRQRAKQHVGCSRKPFDLVLFLETTGRKLASTEKKWIRYFKPKHNKQANPEPDESAAGWGLAIGSMQRVVLHLPQPLFDALEEYARDHHGFNRSEAVRAILADVLSKQEVSQ